MATASVGRLFNGVPGEEQISKLVLKKVRKEMSKLDEEKLQEYLLLLEQLAGSIRTGNGFEKLMADGPDGI